MQHCAQPESYVVSCDPTESDLKSFCFGVGGFVGVTYYAVGNYKVPV